PDMVQIYSGGNRCYLLHPRSWLVKKMHNSLYTLKNTLILVTVKRILQPLCRSPIGPFVVSLNSQRNQFKPGEIGNASHTPPPLSMGNRRRRRFSGLYRHRRHVLPASVFVVDVP